MLKEPNNRYFLQSTNRLLKIKSTTRGEQCVLSSPKTFNTLTERQAVHIILSQHIGINIMSMKFPKPSRRTVIELLVPLQLLLCEETIEASGWEEGSHHATAAP